MPRKKTCKEKTSETLKSVDMFGQPVQLKAEGQFDIKSWPGAIISAFLGLIVFMYTVEQIHILKTNAGVNI